ncbi:single-strand DNA endonuclease ASTE1 [Chanos chanos]|uniref:Single-strand DNA endonuclease ASTE1 n=1 Tax=Chanos chanos TaxID=29144 RepID=A0A6J2WCS7_CHACN|nr:protein asteroid homolog 1-like [Chanos chanos]
MGVKGLKTYIEKNPKRCFFRPCNFGNSELVIDGKNLYYTLYFESGLDQMHGGNYDGFENVTIQFFTALRDCDICPYVVLDGGSDHTDKKLETLKQRAQGRIRMAADKSRGSSNNIIPYLSEDVFKQCLTKLKVPFVQCIAEADWEIAALANEKNCPVLSDDSDFYVFNLKAGFLPITYFKWKNVMKIISRSSCKFIEAQQFTVQNLCENFNHMNKDLLPVFATLAGNDYFTPSTAGITMRWEEFSSTAGEFARIDGLLTWLSRFQEPKEAITAVLKHIEYGQNSVAISSSLFKCIKEYALSESSTAKFFSKGTSLSADIPGCPNVLPRWTLDLLTKGKLSSSIIDVLVLGRLAMGYQVEDSALPSSSVTARPIRQAIYGLLLYGQQQSQGDTAPDKASTDGTEYFVEEFDREGVKLTSFRVKAIKPKRQGRFHLETLCEAPKELRQQILLDTLNVSNNSLTIVPPHLQLPVCVTCYWLVNSKPEPHQEHLWALLLGMVYGELCRLPFEEEYESVKEQIQELGVQKKTSELDLEVAHSFSQWQCCLRASLHLNQLLCLPLTEPECARLYCGTLVHRLVSEFKEGIKPESLLVGGIIPQYLFKTLSDAVRDTVGEKFITTMRKGRGKESPDQHRVQYKSVDDISFRFAHLMDEMKDGDDEKDDNAWEEERYRNIHTTRTRHRIKHRDQKYKY